MCRTIKDFFYSVRLKKQLHCDRLLLNNNKLLVLRVSAKHIPGFFIFCFTICFVLFAWSLVFCADALAAPTNNHIDAILVMDTSGSMSGSDKDKVSVEAAKMFVDMMDINGSRVGMLGFSDTIAPRIMMSEVSNLEDKETVKRAVDDFFYQGFTDIGMALKQAQFIYENSSKSENSPVVLLFTDGNIEMDDGNMERTYSESIQDINEVIKDLKGTVPIYTIGLNSNGSVDESLLQNISDATGGRCYVTDSPKDLPAIFNEIFADHIKSSIIDVDLFFSDGSTYKDVTINIPDDNVVEANIIIFSEKELIDAKITDPNGTPLEFTGSNTVLFSKSAKYSIVKLLNPSMGDWILSVSGQKEDLIKVNLLFDYEIYFSMNASPAGEVKEGDVIKIEASLTSNGSDVVDTSFSDTFDAHFIVADEFGNELERRPLALNASGRFEASYTVSKELFNNNSEVSIYCVAKNDRVSRESQRVTFTAAREQTTAESTNPDSENQTEPQNVLPVPTIKSGIKNISIMYVPVLFGKAEINLLEHIENASSYIVSETSFISSSIIGNTLTITPKAQDSGKITVTAANGLGDKVSLDFLVSTFNLLPYILIALSVTAIVIATYFVKKSNKLKNTLFSGNIRMVAIDSQGSYSPPELIDLSFTTGLTKLRSLVQGIDKDTLPLNKILIYPDFDDKGLPLIGVINKSNCTIIGEFDIKISGKKFMWHNNLTISIKDESNAEASVLELEYRN